MTGANGKWQMAKMKIKARHGFTTPNTHQTDLCFAFSDL
jgi:hypothetical protein